MDYLVLIEKRFAPCRRAAYNVSAASPLMAELMALDAAAEVWGIPVAEVRCHAVMEEDNAFE